MLNPNVKPTDGLDVFTVIRSGVRWCETVRLWVWTALRTPGHPAKHTCKASIRHLDAALEFSITAVTIQGVFLETKVTIFGRGGELEDTYWQRPFNHTVAMP